MTMKRSTKKALVLATGSVLLAGTFASHAAAATDTWLTTVGSQDWFNGANWSSNPAIPGSGDTALFNVVPPSSAVSIGSSSSVGAVFFNDFTTNNQSLSTT